MKHIDAPADPERFPFTSFVVDGLLFDATCNGFALGARLVAQASHVAPADEKKLQNYVEMLTVPPGPHAARVSASDLLKAVGTAEPCRRGVCDECRGSGRHRHADGDCACERCRCDNCDDGYRWSDRVRRPMRIAGAAVNGNLVAMTLDAIGVEAGDGPVRLYRCGDEGRLLLVAETWRAIVMPDTLVDDKAPRFP